MACTRAASIYKLYAETRPAAFLRGDEVVIVGGDLEGLQGVVECCRRAEDRLGERVLVHPVHPRLPYDFPLEFLATKVRLRDAAEEKARVGSLEAAAARNLLSDRVELLRHAAGLRGARFGRM